MARTKPPLPDPHWPFPPWPNPLDRDVGRAGTLEPGEVALPDLSVPRAVRRIERALDEVKRGRRKQAEGGEDEEPSSST